LNKKENDKINCIEGFLEQFRVYMDTFNLTFADRERDIYKDIEDLEINFNIAEDIIRGLTYKNYEKGPETDHSYNDQNIWVFGYEVKEKMAYIKLTDKCTNLAKCLSFHIADYPMRLPYQKEKENTEE